MSTRQLPTWPRKLRTWSKQIRCARVFGNVCLSSSAYVFMLHWAGYASVFCEQFLICVQDDEWKMHVIALVPCGRLGPQCSKSLYRLGELLHSRTFAVLVYLISFSICHILDVLFCSLFTLYNDRHNNTAISSSIVHFVIFVKIRAGYHRSRWGFPGT